MNKDEIQHKLEQAVKDVAKLQVEVEVLEMELAKAKKPKLRHGDWWLTRDSNCIRIFMKEYNHAHRDCVALNDCLITNIGSNYDGEPVLGNIFDLLKEWEEDLTEFKVGCTSDNNLEFHLKATLERNGDYRIGTQTDTIIISAKQVEKYWLFLGRLIATLKRKENKCS